MKSLPKNLIVKLEARIKSNALRHLPESSNLVDFTSNDYLGFSKSEAIFNAAHQYLLANNFTQNGATGSRLISGNHQIYREAENFIAQFHQSESALIFNSGYDANVGFFSAVPQKRDLILYDELCHASIRDGIQLSNAKSYKFKHNDFEDLERLILRSNGNEIILNEAEQHPTTVYIVTESVFSMDGDCPNIEELLAVSEKYGCYVVVDEAHALGVFGISGAGLVQQFIFFR